MPELPDVETFRRYFDATSLHQEIEGVQVKESTLLAGVTQPTLEHALLGNQFQSSERVGKYLFGRLNQGDWLVFHFGMTGSFQYFKDPAAEPDHTGILIRFTNGYHLAYIDVRKFGMITLAKSIDSFISEKKLGPDALTISFEQFRELLKGRHSSVKSILMNQSIVSGIGNIYSDEILFQAGIRPEKRVDSLKDEMVHTLYTTIRDVLETAIEAGAATEKLPKTYLIPHRERGGICPRCGRPLFTTKVSGRTTYFCPENQHG
jgi:formamidopyrimidine-DNA glycosylase